MEALQSLGLTSNFSIVDWVIVVIYLAGTVAIGLYANRFIKGMEDYVVAGRRLKSSLGIATMIGSELGLVTLMYSAQKGFTGGFAAFHIALLAGVVTLVVGLTGFIVVPLRRMGVMTIPEFYERRFSRGVRVFGGLILVLAGVLNMGMFLKVGSTFVTGLLGIHSTMELNIVMTILLVLVLAYTILGGMISVVLTDYVQFVVLSFGLLLTCVLSLRAASWSHLVERVTVLRGEAGFDPFGESFGLTYVAWMAFTAGLVSCAVWQTAVMRACSVDSTKTVRRLYIWSSLGFSIRFLIPYFIGVCALVFLADNPTTATVFFPADKKPIASEVSMTAMPLYLSQLLPAGVIGVVAAGMLAAFMSTHDSYLLCWSSVLTQDVVAPLLGDRMTMRVRLLLTRVFVGLIGVFLLVWSLWYNLVLDLWDYFVVTGAVYFTGAFALLVTGLYWRGASTAGAYAALITGFAAILGLGTIQAALGWGVSSEVVGLSTAAGSLVAMFLFSLLFPDRRTSMPEPIAEGGGIR